MDKKETYEEAVDRIYKEKKKRMKKHQLKGLFLEMTLRCNAKCEHCGSSCGDKITKDEITKEELIKALTEIAEAYGNEKPMLYVTGGEPLLRKDLFEILDYAVHKLGYVWGMTSNGMLINEKIVKKMVETNMYSISISIDGDKELHESFRKTPGSFEKILKGIRLMQECPTIKSVQVTTCVNKKNINKLDDIYKILKENNVKDWRFIQVDPIGRAKDNDSLLLSKEEYRKMYKYILDMRRKDPDMKFSYSCGHFLGNDLNMALINSCFLCTTGYEVASILSNGDVSGCPDILRRKELVQGNIKKRSFIDIWENEFKNYRSINRTSNRKCKKCPDWKSCCGDAFHTWDFKENKPGFCVREVFKDHYIKE